MQIEKPRILPLRRQLHPVTLGRFVPFHAQIRHTEVFFVDLMRFHAQILPKKSRIVYIYGSIAYGAWFVNMLYFV